MKVTKAIEWLKNLRNENEEIVAIFIREEELRQVVGEKYPHMERLAGVLSRTPDFCDLDANYWWEKRETFRQLVEEAIEYIEDENAEEKVREANAQLLEELGLENICSLDVPYEIRPLAVFADRELKIGISFQTPETVTVPAGATWADVLRAVDALNRDPGDHQFLEGYNMVMGDDGTVTAEFYFGS